MQNGKEFSEWLREHYSDVDSDKLAAIYESEYHPGDFMSVFTSAYNTVGLKKWVNSEKCTWNEEQKMDFAYKYVFAKEQCDKFEEYVRDQGMTKARYNRWKNGQVTEAHPPKNDIKKMFEDSKKKKVTKKAIKQKETKEEEQSSLKIRVKTKADKSSEKSEEAKPKKE